MPLRIGIRLAIDKIGAPAIIAPPPSAEAQQFLDRAGSLNALHRNAYIAAIDHLVSGPAPSWTKIDFLKIHGTQTEAASLQNLRQNLFHDTVVGTPTFAADNGWTTGPSSDYLASGFTPSTAGGVHAQNSAHLMAWSGTSALLNGRIVMANLAIPAVPYIIPRGTADVYTGQINDNSVISGVASTDGAGMFTINRVDNANRRYHKNGAFISSVARASVALSAGELITAGNVTQGNSVFNIKAWGTGAGLTDAEDLNLYTAVHGFLQTVGAVA